MLKSRVFIDSASELFTYCNLGSAQLLSILGTKNLLESILLASSILSASENGTPDILSFVSIAILSEKTSYYFVILVD